MDIQLHHVKALIADKDYRLEVTAAARVCLAEVGYGPTFDAHPLRRAIQQELQDPLVLKTLSGDFREGNTIRVDRGPEGGVVA